MTDTTQKAPVIDIDMLTMALQAVDLDTSWWLDTYSGHVLLAPDADGDAMEQKLIRQKQRSPDRFIDIEPIAKSVHNELMESYIATLEQAEICESLYASLQRERPAWHFKNALAKDPECEDNWYAFKEQFYALQARQWLRDRGLEYMEYTTIKAASSKPVSLEAAGKVQTFLELTISLDADKRRYLVWQQGEQISLTVFNIDSNNNEQPLSEMRINEHQFSGINRIIGSYKPYIDIQPRDGDNRLDSYLSFSNDLSKGEIHGNYGSSDMFQQLVTMLDMLLGIAGLEA